VARHRSALSVILTLRGRRRRVEYAIVRQCTIGVMSWRGGTVARRRSALPVVPALPKGRHVGYTTVCRHVGYAIVRQCTIGVMSWRGGTVARRRSALPVVLALPKGAHEGLTRDITTREEYMGE
jgi:hypothetical protein